MRCVEDQPRRWNPATPNGRTPGASDSSERPRSAALYQSEPDAACGSCGVSSRTTGTTKACEAGRRWAVIAGTVMVGSGSAARRARAALGVTSGGEVEVDQRGVHDSG